MFRETAVGQLIRFVTRNKVLQYPEEKEDFSWAPLVNLLLETIVFKIANIKEGSLLAKEDKHIGSQDGFAHTPLNDVPEKRGDEEEEEEPAGDDEKIARDGHDDLEKGSTNNDHPAPYALASIATAPDHEHHHHEHHAIAASHTQHSVLSRTSTSPYTQERFEVERQLEAERSKSIVIAPTKTSDGTILVDWYTTDDPANPQNWAASRKSAVLVQLAAYSMAVYGASSMYVPGEQGVMYRFHVGATPAAMGLAIYVIGYGIGPLLWAPLSEIPAIGRNLVYVPTFFLFVILSIPTAVVDNYAGLLVLRFLTGFFGSPCLANGGASVGDMVSCDRDILELRF